MHNGVDIKAPQGTQVRATGAGTVIKAGWEDPRNPAKGFGQYVKIDHGNGNVSLYGHLSAISVREGARVERGTVLGDVGSTGTSTGAHLHYEERHRGKAHAPTYDPDGFGGAPLP
jgi:murein DD-endopeptidase MepM/ murein hydrolase activator NlpD